MQKGVGCKLYLETWVMVMAQWSSHWNEQWHWRWICVHFSWKHLTLSARPTKIAKGEGEGEKEKGL
jgi:hypothetical protein